jgi:hypothetical protein
MKRISAVVFLVASFFATTHASGPGKEMERLKSLVGTWEGKDEQGNPIQLSYKLVSDDNTLVETLDNAGHKESMITVYHIDGDKVMLTHYCSVGNQPRMKEVSSDASSISFSFVDGTNMKSGDPHMHELTIRWIDADHIVQEWTMQVEGKNNPPAVFALQRKS